MPRWKSRVRVRVAGVVFERRWDQRGWTQTFVKTEDGWRPLGWYESPGGRRELNHKINGQRDADLKHRWDLPHKKKRRRKKR
jgi:hypothetical protein